MKGSIFISGQEKNDILKQHQTIYDGYATKNNTSNMTPLTVYDPYKDKQGVTVNAKGEVKTYTNHKINEIAAKALNYDEIEPAYEFDSQGPGDPNLGYDVYNQTLPSYDFDSKGPVDVYEDECDECSEDVNESVKKTLNMFKRIKKFN